MKFRPGLKKPAVTSARRSSDSRWLQVHIHGASLLVCRCAGTLLPRGFPLVLPSSDQLHVRRGQARCPGAAGLHLLHVAEARRGGHRNPTLLRCSLAAQRAGAAARPAHPHRAARRRQGAPSLQVHGGPVRTLVKSVSVALSYVQMPPNL